MKPKLAVPLAKLRQRHRHRHRYRPGDAPGSLQSAEDEGGAQAQLFPPARITLLHYTRDGVQRDTDEVLVADCRPPAAFQPDAAVQARQAHQAQQEQQVQWVHVQGPPTAVQMQQLGANYGLHPLALEDVLHGESRAKAEIYSGNQQFVVLDVLCTEDEGSVGHHQVAFFLGKNWVISFCDTPDDLFAPVRKRIRAGGKVREAGADYLLYALVDVVVDSGFPLLEALGDRLEALEEQVLENPDQQARNHIHYAKRELVQMRHAWWPQREVIATLMRDDSHLLSENTRLYMRDCHEHSVIVIDFVETYREMATSLLDTYLSAVNQRMNDIMKTLTVIATIFLPLTFITSLYGMNFSTESPWNMPELSWRFGYFYALGVMTVVVLGMLAWFRRKRWL